MNISNYNTKSLNISNILKTIKSEGIIKYFKENFLGSKDSNIKLSMSVAIGVLTGILPIWGFQTILAVFLAFSMKLNKLLLLTASHISVPPFTPVIIFLSFLVGGILYNSNSIVLLHYKTQVDYNFIKENIYQYIIGSIILALLLALFLGILTYLLLFICRKDNNHNY